MNTKEILIAARDLIADPARWTTARFARDEFGNELLDPSSPRAACWCARGAIQKIGGRPDKPGTPAYGAAEYLYKACVALFGKTVFLVNDGPNGHARILKAFDHAIAEAA